MTRRRGRPSLAESAKHQSLIFAVARLRIVNGLSVEHLAGTYRVSPRTIIRWSREAMSGDSPESIRLRELYDRQAS